MLKPGDIISYNQMCIEEKANLQRGMNFGHGQSYSVILMSQRKDALYDDSIEEDGKILIYEGHNIRKSDTKLDPKTVNQPLYYPSGKPTQNGKFYEAAQQYKKSNSSPESVRVYEKLFPGTWVYNGLFDLVDSWIKYIDGRYVCKFKLKLNDCKTTKKKITLEHNRMIPSNVKREVWKRDLGRCKMCGSKENLHFDHIIPFSKGGSSLVAENIQLLCAKHNLEKRDNIV